MEEGTCCTERVSRRKQLLLGRLVNGRGCRGVSPNPTPSDPPLLINCLLPPDAAGSQQISPKTLAVSSNCYISLAPAEAATNICHISFLLQLLPITERPQKTERIPVGIHHMKRLPATQSVGLPHPKAPVRTLPNWTTMTVKNLKPREVTCWVSLTSPPCPGCFLNPCGQETFPQRYLSGVYTGWRRTRVLESQSQIQLTCSVSFALLCFSEL